MSPKEFEKYLESLNDEQYSALVQERITRLSEDQQKLVQAREARRKDRLKIWDNMVGADLDSVKKALQEIVDGEGHACEHGRSWVKHCLACGEIDHLMFPELFDEDGFPLEERG